MGCCTVLHCVAVWVEVDLSARPASSFRVMCILNACQWQRLPVCECLHTQVNACHMCENGI